MTAPDETLARRAVAAKAWRWLPGMRAQRWHDGLAVRIFDHERHVLEASGKLGGGALLPAWLPDLADAATIGALLALVREAHHDSQLSVSHSGPWHDPLTGEVHPARWEVHAHQWSNVMEQWASLSEAAALVAALESAPERAR